MIRPLICTLLLATSISPGVEAKPLRTASGSPMVKLERGDGMIMLRLIQTDYVASYLPTWERFHFHDASTGAKFEVIDPYGPGHSTYFVASVPPGEYVADRVSKAQADGSVPGYVTWGEAEFGPQGGWHFRVERGRLTNLGTVFFVRPYNQSNNPVFRWVHFPDEALPLRSQYLFESGDRPALLAPPVGWTRVPPQSSAPSLTPQTKHLSMVLAGMAPATGGGRLFGELFGQVAWRHPDGSWTWEETGALETILAAIDASDGTRWAVAEGSALLKREAGGAWSRIPVPLDDARPCLLYGDSDGSLLTAWAQPKAITVLRYRPSSENPWSTEHVVEAPSGVLALQGSFDRCSASLTSRGLLLVEKITAFSQKYRVELLDSASGRWSSSKFSIVSPLVVTPDGALLVLGGLAINPKYRLSRDLGKTWEDRANPAALGMPLFKSASEGYLLRREGGVLNVPVSTTLWRTLDGSKSWQPVTTFTDPPFDTVRMFDDTTLFATSYGLLYSTSDLGRRLKLERNSSAKLW